MPRSSRMIAFARRAMRCSTRPRRAMAIRCRLSSSLRKLDRIMGVMNRGQPALAIPFRLLTVSGYIIFVEFHLVVPGTMSVHDAHVNDRHQSLTGLETAC